MHESRILPCRRRKCKRRAGPPAAHRLAMASPRRFGVAEVRQHFQCLDAERAGLSKVWTAARSPARSVEPAARAGPCVWLKLPPASFSVKP